MSVELKRFRVFSNLIVVAFFLGILEAMVKGQRETPDKFPKIITCPNEVMLSFRPFWGFGILS